MSAPEAAPYRPNVGAALFDAAGRVFVGRRADLSLAPGLAGAWQLPQGGIDAGETPQQAVLRELAEEIGTDRFRIIGEHPDWLTYDFPPSLRARGIFRNFRGQRQRWFALRFLGEDADIQPTSVPHPEFDAWRWADLAELPGLAVPFKRPVYDVVTQAFARFAVPVE